MSDTTFRHKCPPHINPKQMSVNDGAVRAPAYSAHIRREYPVPPTAQWSPLLEGDPREMRLGILRPTGREMTVVRCPDCDSTVVVTRQAG